MQFFSCGIADSGDTAFQGLPGGAILSDAPEAETVDINELQTIHRNSMRQRKSVRLTSTCSPYLYFFYLPLLTPHLYLRLTSTSSPYFYFFYLPLLLLPTSTYASPLLLLPTSTSSTYLYFFYLPLLTTHLYLRLTSTYASPLLVLPTSISSTYLYFYLPLLTPHLYLRITSTYAALESDVGWAR